MDFSLRDILVKLAESDSKPYFTVTEKYESEETSTQLLEALLRYQFGDEWVAVTTTIFKIVEKTNGKQNSIHFLWPRELRKNLHDDSVDFIVFAGWDDVIGTIKQQFSVPGYHR